MFYLEAHQIVLFPIHHFLMSLYYVCCCFSILQGENLIVAVDDDGCFTSKITDFSGRYVKDADKDIIQAVKVFAWTLIVLQ